MTGTGDEIAAAAAGWLSALRDQDNPYFAGRLASHFTWTAHPFPRIDLDKAAYLALLKRAGAIDIGADRFDLRQIGDHFSVTLAGRFGSCPLAADPGAGLPDRAQYAALFGGRDVAWRTMWSLLDGHATCIDCHFVGSV